MRFAVPKGQEDEMKKITVLTAAFVFFTAALFAADGTVGYRNLKIHKVYEHPEAFIILYYSDSMDMGQVTVPSQWFKFSAGDGKGILNTYTNSVTPYMTLQYKDGVFTKMVLNMPLDRNSIFWEPINQSSDVEAAKQKDTLKLE